MVMEMVNGGEDWDSLKVKVKATICGVHQPLLRPAYVK